MGAHGVLSLKVGNAELTALRLKIGGALEEMRSHLESRVDAMVAESERHRLKADEQGSSLRECEVKLAVLEDDVKTNQKWNSVEHTNADKENPSQT